MTTSPEALVRRLIEDGFNACDLDVVDEVIAPDLAEHQPFGPNHAPGADGVKAVIRSLHRSCSDFHLEIEDVAISGDTVWLRMAASGTNDGSFMGHPPTGRTMAVTVVDVLRVADGKIVEHWGVPDRLEAMFQLGLVRPPAPGPIPATA